MPGGERSIFGHSLGGGTGHHAPTARITCKVLVVVVVVVVTLVSGSCNNHGVVVVVVVVVVVMITYLKDYC